MAHKFAQVDPAYDQTKDDPESWNLYNYVTNNPVTKTDPDGRTYFGEDKQVAQAEVLSLKGNLMDWGDAGFGSGGDMHAEFNQMVAAAYAQNPTGVTQPVQGNQGGDSTIQVTTPTTGVAQTNQPYSGGINPAGFALPGSTLASLSLATGSLGLLGGTTSQAAPMTKDNGDIIFGASGTPALAPAGWSAQKFATMGERAKNTPDLALALLSNFRQGGAWDLQRLGGSFDRRFVDAATIGIGVYAAAAGIPFKDLMNIQSDFGKRKSSWGQDVKMSDSYPNLPERNVNNTIIGYGLYFNRQVTSQ